MSAEEDSDAQRQQEALSQVSKCWTNACVCLAGTGQPQWLRVQNALRSFKGLPLDHLPKKLDRRVDLTFRRVNAVLANYTIKTWDDYQNISPDDLKKIETLIRTLI